MRIIGKIKEEKMNYKEEYKKWCESQIFDEETKKELKKIKKEEKEIKNNFF